MIRNTLTLMLLWSLGTAAAQASTGPNPQSGHTDPLQYQARVAQQIKPYLADCTAEFSNAQGVYDPSGVAACKASQAQFAAEYYNALEGNQADKFDLGFMFQRGDQHGVKYNATMACAWWIEAANTGGRLPHAIFDSALAQACSTSQDAINEAAALQAEENRIANLTY